MFSLFVEGVFGVLEVLMPKRRWLRLLIGLVIVALFVGFVAFLAGFYDF